jgi:hypothetical protein
MFAYDRSRKGYLDDSMTIESFILNEDDETLIPEDTISAVEFTIVKPGGDPAAPDVDSEAGTVVADGHGRYVVDPLINDTAGNYLGKATFTYTVGEAPDDVEITRSVPFEYVIVDPFERTATDEPTDDAVALTWKKLDDCFDSELGGPWLRDMSKNHFDHSTIRDFIPETILEINSVMPVTEFTVESFPYEEDGTALMAQGLLVATIKHLMRSYTEQPTVGNSPIGYLDREQYQQKWSVMYQVEMENYRRWLELWKRRFINISGSKMLISVRSGRNLPGSYRLRGGGRGISG